MTKESEIYRVLPQTKDMLEADIERRRGGVETISRQGAELWEGDQWHSTAYRQQQLQKELAIRYLQLIVEKGGKIESLPEPTQNDIVEVGHMVKVRLIDDVEIKKLGLEFTLVHVFTKEDAQYLGEKFDNLSEMIISQESPIGRAVIGLRRGQETTYLGEQRLEILDVEDTIQVSSLFK